MTIKRLVCRSMAGLAAIILVITALVVPSNATDGPHRAGLIIVHSNGQMSQRCVEFSGETISGLEFLQQSGLDLTVDATNSVGVAVCRIDSEGCTFPSQACFCQCQGAKCVYWSYWHLTSGGAWQYSSLGAGNRILHDGDVDAWMWGPVTNTSINLLPALRFDQICAPPTPTASPTATATATLLPPTATPPPLATNTPLPPTTWTVPSATSTRPSSAVMPALPTDSTPATSIHSPSATSSASITASSAPVTPTPTWQPRTPVIATPTTPPAPTGAQSAAATTTQPAGTEAFTGQSAAAIAMASPTSGSTLAAVTQSAPSATPRPAPTGPKPTPLLAAVQSPTPVQPSRPPASLDSPSLAAGSGDHPGWRWDMRSDAPSAEAVEVADDDQAIGL